MRSVYKASLLMLILATVLTGCGGGLVTSTPVDPGSISTAMVATLVASAFQAQTAAAPITLPTFPSQIPTVSTIYSISTSVSPTATFLYDPTLAPVTPSVTGKVYTPIIDASSLS